jgi:hypothetical protein
VHRLLQALASAVASQPRWRRRSVAYLASAVLATSCSHRRPPAPCCIDLLEALRGADIRPTDRPADAVHVIDAAVGGQVKRSLSAAVPTRVIYTLRIPPHAIFSTSLSADASAPHATGAGVVFRLGISDGRVYEPLLDQSIPAREEASWTPVRLDLSRYAGWQWSLFYHPSNIVWQLVLNTYPSGAGAEHLRGLWATPAIEGRH